VVKIGFRGWMVQGPVADRAIGLCHHRGDPNLEVACPISGLGVLAQQARWQGTAEGQAQRCG
jgi:hypothetical protein